MNKCNSVFEQHKEIFNVIPLAIVKCKIILDIYGEVKDLLFLEANKYFENITNIDNQLLYNKSFIEMFPEIKNSLFDWIRIIGEAALISDNKSIEQYFEIFNKYLKIQIYSLNKDYFYIFISDLTEKKENRKAILKRDRQIEYLENEIKKKAIFDSLTNTYNHQFIVDNINNEIENYKKNKVEFTVVLIDIDDFKKINNKYGRKKGDIVLKEIADAIKMGVRKIDIIGRYGCDKFAIILTNVDIDIAKVIVDRIINDIDKYVNDLPGKKVTVSGAILEYNGETIEEYLEKLEQKLLKAKSIGQNIVMI